LNKIIIFIQKGGRPGRGMVKGHPQSSFLVNKVLGKGWLAKKSCIANTHLCTLPISFSNSLLDL
jgi:hypothetical protein